MSDPSWHGPEEAAANLAHRVEELEKEKEQHWCQWPAQGCARITEMNALRELVATVMEAGDRVVAAYDARDREKLKLTVLHLKWTISSYGNRGEKDEREGSGESQAK